MDWVLENFEKIITKIRKSLKKFICNTLSNIHLLQDILVKNPFLKKNIFWPNQKTWFDIVVQ